MHEGAEDETHNLRVDSKGDCRRQRARCRASVEEGGLQAPGYECEGWEEDRKRLWTMLCAGGSSPSWLRSSFGTRRDGEGGTACYPAAGEGNKAAVKAWGHNNVQPYSSQSGLVRREVLSGRRAREEGQNGFWARAAAVRDLRIGDGERWRGRLAQEFGFKDWRGRMALAARLTWV